MMDQITSSEVEYQNKKRKTRRQIFLERMKKLISWIELEKKVARYYLIGQNGRPQYPLPIMQHFACLRLDRLPIETTILKFQCFLEHLGLDRENCLGRLARVWRVTVPRTTSERLLPDSRATVGRDLRLF
jgi:hypothetical protein